MNNDHSINTLVLGTIVPNNLFLTAGKSSQDLAIDLFSQFSYKYVLKLDIISKNDRGYVMK